MFPADNSIALVYEVPDAQSIAPQPELPTGDFPGTISDMLPMFSLHLSRVDVGIDLLVQQTAVGSDSVDNGVGFMITFKSSQTRVAGLQQRRE